jgi:hypothetical protein
VRIKLVSRTFPRLPTLFCQCLSFRVSCSSIDAKRYILPVEPCFPSCAACVCELVSRSFFKRWSKRYLLTQSADIPVRSSQRLGRLVERAALQPKLEMSTPTKKNHLPTPPTTARKPMQTKLPFPPQKSQYLPKLKPAKQEIAPIDDDLTWKTEFDQDLVQEVETLLEALITPEMSELERTLKSFDMNTKFGPQTNMSRLERYFRAVEFELNPDTKILAILRALDAVKDPSKRKELNIDKLLSSSWSGPQF